MIEFIKEYGISNIDYENILHNLKSDFIELISLSEPSVREVLSYYNGLGITSSLTKIFLNRPDLILISLENLKELVEKVDIDLFRNFIDKEIENLILLGI